MDTSIAEDSNQEVEEETNKNGEPEAEVEPAKTADADVSMDSNCADGIEVEGSCDNQFDNSTHSDTSKNISVKDQDKESKQQPQEQVSLFFKW